MAELVYALALGASGVIHEGSSPSQGTKSGIKSELSPKPATFSLRFCQQNQIFFRGKLAFWSLSATRVLSFRNRFEP